MRVQQPDLGSYVEDVTARLVRAWHPYRMAVEWIDTASQPGVAYFSVMLGTALDPLRVTGEVRLDQVDPVRLELVRGDGSAAIDHARVSVVAPSVLPVDLDPAVQAIVAVARVWKEGSAE